MKASIILVSVLIAVSVWWWYRLPRNAHKHRSGYYRLHSLFRSVAAGIAAYFTLMLIAMLYLLLTTA